MLWYGKSDIGMVRSANQDSFIARKLTADSVLCSVCDGMGGKAGGSEASRLALTVFESEVAAFMKKAKATKSSEISDSEIKRMLADSVDRANSEVYKAACSDHTLSGMGTTLVAALVIGSMLYSVNIGDSRMYIIKDGQATQHTHDHSYVQYLVDIGKLTPDEAKKSTNKNIITRAVGIDEKVDSDISSMKLPDSSGDYILLCSDGLTNHMENHEIAQIIQKNGDTLEQKADALISAANGRGGTDNITVVLLEL